MLMLSIVFSGLIIVFVSWSYTMFTKKQSLYERLRRIRVFVNDIYPAEDFSNSEFYQSLQKASSGIFYTERILALSIAQTWGQKQLLELEKQVCKLEGLVYGPVSYEHVVENSHIYSSPPLTKKNIAKGLETYFGIVELATTDIRQQ